MFALVGFVLKVFQVVFGVALADYVRVILLGG